MDHITERISTFPTWPIEKELDIRITNEETALKTGGGGGYYLPEENCIEITYNNFHGNINLRLQGFVFT